MTEIENRGLARLAGSATILRITSSLILKLPMKLHCRPPGFAATVALVCLLGGFTSGQVFAHSTAQTPKKISTRTAQKPTAKPAYSSQASKARADALSKARLAARVRMARDNAVPRFKTDSTGTVVPDLHAAAAIIYDPQTHQVLWEENSHDQRSIASITKVMTAVVFIESGPDMTQVVSVDRSDTTAASATHLRAGHQVSVHDLLHLLLISSDNAAARALARVSPWGPAGFVARMNEKAIELGLQNTSYADPSGLDANNVSSAYDMARLIAYASSDDRISEIMRKPEFTVTLSRQPVRIHSTNQLLSRADMEGNVLGAKTGFIGRSGYCLATLLKMPQVNQPVAVVVLGARSNAGRFAEVRNLFTWLTTKAQDLLVKKDHEEPDGRSPDQPPYPR
jgi:D-alanyl-D-alanine endopeptidase (penicillin-binding protein 7)